MEETQNTQSAPNLKLTSDEQIQLLKAQRLGLSIAQQINTLRGDLQRADEAFVALLNRIATDHSIPGDEYGFNAETLEFAPKSSLKA